jgi:hypothetical protein
VPDEQLPHRCKNDAPHHHAQPRPEVFQFSASDVNGAGYIAAFQGWFGSTTSGQNSCYFQYTREGDTIALLDDTGTFFTQGGPAELGSSTVLYNNQCRIVLQNSSVSRLNNTLILNLSIVFNSSFTGTKTLQVNVFDESGEQTDWQTVGSWAAYQAPPQTQPAATGIWPNSGTIGMAVTIFGSNFGASQGSSSLTINGVSAGAASFWSDTSISIIVPAGATTGYAVVTVNGSSSNGVLFSVIPKISSVSPASGAPGTQITVSGSGFGSTRHAGGIWLGTTYARVVS